MSVTGSLSDAVVCVVLDVRNPQAYLALRPSIELGRDMGIDVDWLPIEAQPLRPPAPADASDDRATRHKWHRANMIAREIAVYSQSQGLTVREPYRDGSPAAAHLAWLWVRARARHRLPECLQEIFRRYWALELDAASLNDAARMLRDLDFDASEFERWARGEGDQQAERLAAAIRDAGVHQAPAYLVEDELFYGRQHLPMIRWIVGGRSGPVPI